METENKYKTFGELKVGDEIIAVGNTTNDKDVYEVAKIERKRDCRDVDFLDCDIIKLIDGRWDEVEKIYVPVLAYAVTWGGNDNVLISDANNADKIIEEIRINKKREQEEESKRKRLEAIREQAQKNPPRFITLNSNVSKEEFIINVDSIRTVWKNKNVSIVYLKEAGQKFTVSNDYEEIKAKLGL